MLQEYTQNLRRVKKEIKVEKREKEDEDDRTKEEHTAKEQKKNKT